jgi:hypothetical protein
LRNDPAEKIGRATCVYLTSAKTELSRSTTGRPEAPVQTPVGVLTAFNGINAL